MATYRSNMRTERERKEHTIHLSMETQRKVLGGGGVPTPAAWGTLGG
jgi:hypothetical protein